MPALSAEETEVRLEQKLKKYVDARIKERGLDRLAAIEGRLSKIENELEFVKKQSVEILKGVNEISANLPSQSTAH